MEKRMQRQNWWQLMRQNFAWRQFIVGALVPIAIFYSFHRLNMSLTGALLAAGWGASVAAITHLYLRRTNLFAILSVPFALIEIIGTIVTLSPTFYLASSAIDKTLWGIVFLGSIVISRPLILVFAQATGSLDMKQFGRFGSTDLFRSAWVKLTFIWGVVNLITAILLFASQILLPLEIFLIIRITTGIPLFAALLIFSFWFPGWYWKKALAVAGKPNQK